LSTSESICELMDKNKINPLMVIMSVRDFPISWYWLNSIDFIDKLIIKYHLHHEAHEIARKYIVEHGEYTHMIISTDDIVATPSHVELLIRDVAEYGYPVISCYTNWEWVNDWVNITDRDMRGINVYMPQQYRFYRLKKLLGEIIEGRIEYPLKRVFYVGLPLTIIDRKVVEEVGIRPYRYVTDSALGIKATRGIMHDLQFAIDCADNNIPIYVDLRCLTIHFGDTRRYINLRGKKPEVVFVERRKCRP